MALAFAVLWGVLFPVLSDAVANQEISVSKPYYDFFAVVFGLPLLFLAGVGPVIAWRRSSLRGAGRVFLWPFVSAAASTAILVLAGYGSSPPGVIAISLCLFVAVTVVLELVRGTRARKALTPGISWPRALVQLVGPQPAPLRRLRRPPGDRRRRRRDRRQHRLLDPPGASPEPGRVDLDRRLSGALPAAPAGRQRLLRRDPGPARGAPRRLVARPDRARPASVPRRGVPSNEVAIHSDLPDRADFYAILSGVDANGRALMTLIVNPLVNLLWLAGFLLALGVGIAIWPDPREARRLATRFSRDPAALERR